MNLGAALAFIIATFAVFIIFEDLKYKDGKYPRWLLYVWVAGCLLAFGISAIFSGGSSDLP